MLTTTYKGHYLLRKTSSSDWDICEQADGQGWYASADSLSDAIDMIDEVMADMEVTCSL